MLIIGFEELCMLADESFSDFFYYILCDIANESFAPSKKILESKLGQKIVRSLPNKF